MLLPDMNKMYGHLFQTHCGEGVGHHRGLSSKGSNHKTKHLQSRLWFCSNISSFFSFRYFFTGSSLLLYHAEMPSEYLENQRKWVKTLCLSVPEPPHAKIINSTGSLGCRNYPEQFTNTNTTSQTKT